MIMNEEVVIKPGDEYGDLVVVEEAGRNRHGARRWLCRCLRTVDGKPCGRTTLKTKDQLVNARTTRACNGCAASSMTAHRRRYYTNFYRY